MSKIPVIIRWQEESPPQEQQLRKRMREEGLSPYAWSNAPGMQYAVHSHSYEKVLYCVQGSVRFVLPDQQDERGEARAIDLVPGDCMILPAGVRHSALVGEQGVICLEAPRHSR
ncbi:MAG: cupin [Ktedonobacteraceae bacterium]|nr:cupin [Ktedonobacteraceae bacterium]